MVFRSIRLVMLAMLATLVLNACAPAVLLNASIEQDRFAKTFSPPEDKSLVYVYLDEPTPNIAKHVEIDGRVAGLIRPSFYLMSRVAPGHHRVGLGHAGADSIALDTDPGKMYFISVHASCEDGKTRVQLEIVEESTGKQHILLSRLANITLFGHPLLTDRPAGECGAPLRDAGLSPGAFLHTLSFMPNMRRAS